MRHLVVNAVGLACIRQAAFLAQPEHRPQIHETDMRRRLPQPNPSELILEEADVEIDIVPSNNRTAERLRDVPSNVVEGRCVRYVRISNAMYLGRRDPTSGINESVEG